MRDHADCTAPTRQHELDPTDHTDHTDLSALKDVGHEVQIDDLDHDPSDVCNNAHFLFVSSLYFNQVINGSQKGYLMIFSLPRLLITCLLYTSPSPRD